MFRLRDLKNGLYQIHKKGGPAYEGTPRTLFETAIKLGVQEQSLVLAVNHLQELNRDYADFSPNGALLYTRTNKR